MKNNIDDSVNLCSPSLSVSESGNEELCSELSPVLDERSRRSLRCCVDGVSDNSPLSARYQFAQQMPSEAVMLSAVQGRAFALRWLPVHVQ